MATLSPNRGDVVLRCGLTSEDLHKMYFRLHTTRVLNDRLIDLKRENKIYGPIHRTTGQEATGIAVGAALRKDDYIISNHRGYGHWIGKGIDPVRLCDEIFGKATGCCKGKGGEMLIADFDNGILSTTIMGGGLTVAAGLGLSSKMRKTGQVTVCFFGEGSSNEGTFHEALNFSARHRLPVIFFCENNRWALSTSVEQSTSVPDIAVRAVGYGMRGFVVDGNDVLEIFELVQRVTKELREGGGPVLIEAKTYRVGTFSSNDRQSGYQPNEEVLRWKAKDPIYRFAQQLQLLGAATSEELSRIEESARSSALAAVAHGEAAEYPDKSALYDHVLVAE